MNRFEIPISPEQLDLGLVVSSGQVFRWRQQPTGWRGMDGGHWYEVVVHPDRMEVSSNAPASEFARLFQLDRDLAAIEAEILASGPELEPYVARLRGLRLMRPWSATEAAIGFLCTANNNLSRIVKMVAELGSYGPAVDCPWGEHAFPTLEVIAAIPEAELRSKGFGYRGGTIPRAAQAMLERGGEAWLMGLREKPYAEAHAELCSIGGIGPKLADCIALFALHHTCAVPVDTHLWQQAVRLYFPEWAGKSLTHPRYALIGEHFRSRFGELAGWAHQYLFYDNFLQWRARGRAATS